MKQKKSQVYNAEYLHMKAAYFELYNKHVANGETYKEAYRKTQLEIPFYASYESFKVVKSRRQNRTRNP